MASLKAAIRQHCKNCTYDQACPGTYLQQIEECTVKTCALWEVRPRTVATIALQRKSRAPEPAFDVDALVAGLDDEEEVEA